MYRPVVAVHLQPALNYQLSLRIADQLLPGHQCFGAELDVSQDVCKGCCLGEQVLIFVQNGGPYGLLDLGIRGENGITHWNPTGIHRWTTPHPFQPVLASLI